MDLLDNLIIGFQTSLSLVNLWYAFLGALLGTLVGVLPGLGPIATIAMLLPSMYSLEPTSALIMLAGIFYGAQYGGSTTAILINVPGEASTVITALDGYQMARQGRAGVALAAAALASFFAGTVGVLVVAAFAPPLAALAFEFGAPEYFALMFLGLVGAVVLASGSLTKALAMVVLGLLLGQINTDAITAVPRFSFDIPELMDGINFVIVAMGVFSFGEIIANLGKPAEHREVFVNDVTGLWPGKKDFRDATPAAARGTLIGCLLGVLPGAGPILASFASYSLEKKLAKHPEEFGQGAIRGVAAPEAANNAGAQTAFIPMLTLGIPTSAVMALMIGAMTLMGIQPGPQVMTSNPALFWGLITSMWVGNLMLVILNLPLIGIWVKLLTVPYRFLFPAIMAFCAIGVYSLSNNTFDVYCAAVFAVVGYLFHKLGLEPAPLILGFILGPMMEENLRRSLLMARGDWGIFLARPIAAAMIAAAVVLMAAIALPAIGRKREEVFVEEED
ncbi:MAG: tripartite tricarboxylate transporter permease [Candidatus Accumulibacter sp.]|jgi:TctA family transporter|nr:tripartite tricarboxylate transporter permease [Accumulibacter sp.]